MLIDSLAILVGLAILVWGADRFVIGAAALASNLGVSAMLIGLTIVGFGTSAPEILVSVVSSLDGNPGLAIGNALGSNIANIGLILGTTALIVPLTVHSSVLKREYPLLLGVTGLSLLLMLDGELNQLDGAILIVVLVAVLGWMIHAAKTGSPTDPIADEFDAEIPHDMPTRRAIFWLVLGLICLLVSSRMLVWGAVNIATTFGISDLVIGLTIVALGTSLPELAASIASALKGEDDLAIGNIIGSNLYNLLAVLSLPGLIAPGAFAEAALYRDQPMMIGLTLALFAMGYGFGKLKGQINRIEGFLLLLAFIGYQTLLFFTLS
ncbi:MAG: calcium/sodium antiporter [endosymbiont of Seepiophila jonesi]|uniref:Calcium/sodium antiporter n=1 Tax=endosymbiont of Lamellibrachia luymesi TaxID=2200907 RepID=A0A370DUT5_9GAMM|nr:MAG: calcium/sodium antiporter [endosymbiont of Lamellibrachia luymesi]RDH91902.1 MAG: calcium/sodium antiporter [endosymbiont of Seepiophila jonesi]